MVCSSVNRMDLVKKMEKALATKKQQLMSNYRLSLLALELQCHCALNDRKSCLELLPCSTACHSVD